MANYHHWINKYLIVLKCSTQNIFLSVNSICPRYLENFWYKTLTGPTVHDPMLSNILITKSNIFWAAMDPYKSKAFNSLKYCPQIFLVKPKLVTHGPNYSFLILPPKGITTWLLNYLIAHCSMSLINLKIYHL